VVRRSLHHQSIIKQWASQQSAVSKAEQAPRNWLFGTDRVHNLFWGPLKIQDTFPKRAKYRAQPHPPLNFHSTRTHATGPRSQPIKSKRTNTVVTLVPKRIYHLLTTDQPLEHSSHSSAQGTRLVHHTKYSCTSYEYTLLLATQELLELEVYQR
jgi:hypothetical protein